MELGPLQSHLPHGSPWMASSAGNSRRSLPGVAIGVPYPLTEASSVALGPGEASSRAPGADPLPHVQVIAPWRMPEFYNRFQGRNDLMEYAKVGACSTASDLACCLLHIPTPTPGGCLGHWLEAGTDPQAGGGTVWLPILAGRLSPGPALQRCGPCLGWASPRGPLCVPLSCHLCCVCHSGDSLGCEPGHFRPLDLAANCPSVFPGTGRGSGEQGPTKACVEPALLKYKLQ